MSVFQQQSAPARTESVREQQQTRTWRNLSTPSKLLEVEKAVSRHGVSERWQTTVQPVRRDAHQPQKNLPTGSTDAGRHDDVDICGLKPLLSQQPLDNGLRG